MSTFFEGPDADDTPCVWGGDPQQPTCVLNPYDLPETVRAEAWPLIVAALCGSQS